MKKDINAINIRPAELLKKLMKNWFWFVLLAGAGFWAANFYLKFQVELYEIEASLKIKEEEENLGRKAIVADMGFNESVNLDDEIFTLKASPLMAEVVKSLTLDITYFQLGRFKDTELYNESPVKAEVLGDKTLAAGRSLKIAPLDSVHFSLIGVHSEKDTLIKKYGAPFSLEETVNLETVSYVIKRKKDFQEALKINFLDPREVAEYYSDKMVIFPIGRTKILNFSLTESVPKKGIDIINRLIEFYGSSIVEENNESARNSLSFIDERLAFVTEELSRAEQNVEFYQNSIQAPLGIEVIADRINTEIEAADSKITQLRLQEDFLINLNKFLDQEGNDYAFLTVPTEAAGEIVSSLVTQYNDLILAREELLISADVGNPYINLMDQQLSSIKNNIKESINLLLQDNRNRIGDLNAKLTPAKESLNAVPQQQRRLLSMTRIKDSKEGLYTYLLESREKAGLSIASQVINLKIIDPPTNLGLVSPIYNFIYMLGIFIGLIIPFAFIVVSDLMDNTIHNETDIKEYTDTPFLGNIGLATKKNELVVVDGSRSAITESFHLLTSNLEFLTPNETKSQVILFTSSISGDGKTFISCNLGASLALAGKKIVLLSFDLRKPKLATYLDGDKSEVGLSNYLTQPKIHASKLIKKVKGFENLSFIGSGPIPPNPTHLINKKRTKTLFDYLRTHFDMILIDTSPVGLVSDALILSKHADASVFIIRHKKTNFSQIPLVDELYKTNKLPNLSIVLNGIKKRRYGYAYAYGNSSGYGYYDDENPKWKKLFKKEEKVNKPLAKPKKSQRKKTISKSK